MASMAASTVHFCLPAVSADVACFDDPFSQAVTGFDENRSPRPVRLDVVDAAMTAAGMSVPGRDQ